MKTKGFVYVVKLKDNAVKVGYTSDFRSRMQQIQTHVPYALNDFWVSDELIGAYNAEQTLLYILHPLQSDGGTECFNASFDVVKRIAESVCGGFQKRNKEPESESEDETLARLGRKHIEKLIEEWCIGRNGKRDRDIMKMHHIDGISVEAIKEKLYCEFDIDLSVDRIKKVIMNRTRAIMSKVK